MFTPGYVCDEDATGSLTFFLDHGEQIKLPVAKSKDLGIVSDEHLSGTGNIVNMDVVPTGACVCA